MVIPKETEWTVDLQPVVQNLVALGQTIWTIIERTHCLSKFIVCDLSPRAEVIHNLIIVKRQSTVNISPKYANNFRSNPSLNKRTNKRQMNEQKHNLSVITLPSYPRLHIDLFWCYKIVFKHECLNFDDFFYNLVICLLHVVTLINYTKYDVVLV